MDRSSIAREGTIKHAFEEKGIIKIAKKDKKDQEIAFERAEEIAIEAGAEELKDEEDDCWTFYSTACDVYSVKAFIEKERTDIDILNCEILYKPVASLPLEDELAETVSNLVDSIASLNEVNKVYDNAS